MFWEASRVLMISQGQEEASALLDKSKFIYSRLPDFIKMRVGKNQSDLITFPTAHSELRALPSTEKAGHGYSASLVVRDELEYHPYAETNFLAVAPSVDSGGQLIDLSTVDKSKSETHFKIRYKEAKAGENNVFPVFLPWHVRPMRTQGVSLQQWFDTEIKRKYKKDQIEQEYPSTEAEALGVLKESQFFDPESLTIMERDCYPPGETRYDMMLHIWKPPVIGNKYIVATDPSTGQLDPHAIIVIDWATLEEVASSHGHCPAELVAKMHDELVRQYNNAFNVFERNANAGGVVEQKLVELHTPNQFRAKENSNQTGWMSSGNQSSNKRMDLLWRLQLAIRNRQIRIHRFEALNDFRWFIHPQDETPRATQGHNDDFVMVWALALEMRRILPSYSGGFKTVKLRRL